MTTQQPQLQVRASNQRVSSALDWDIPELKLLSFEKALSRTTDLNDLKIVPEKSSAKARGLSDDLGDGVMALNKLLFTSAGSVQVPGYGLLDMTPWARRQIGSQIGVRWDKFFDGQDPDKINRAVRDHLKARTTAPVIKVVARKHEENAVGSDGVLRGVVSPSYSELPDAYIMERILATVGKSKLKDMGFSTFDLRDNGSHFALVHKEPISLTSHNLPPNSFRGTAPGHTRPQKDTGYAGLRLRNSEVGAYSFTADAYVMRLVCVNGLMVLVQGERIAKRKHIGLGDTDKIDELLDNTFMALPKIREQVLAQNNRLQKLNIEDPEAEIRSYLGRYHQSKVIQDTVVKAYQDEPVPTAYGVLQAISRASTVLREVPDRQHELELIAASYSHAKAKAA